MTAPKMTAAPLTSEERYPSLVEIREWLPASAFKISLGRSAYYLARDLVLVLAGMALLRAMPYWAWFGGLPLPARVGLLGPVQFGTGFFMWCMFVVGHDCGHGTFCRSRALNRVVGELAHSVVLCTPFYPWMLSHQQHHLYHNHYTKDYSHMWIPKKDGQDEAECAAAFDTGFWIFHRARWLIPLFAWPVYLFAGRPDGGHLVQFGRLWESRTLTDRLNGYLSTGVVLATIAALWSELGWDILHVYVVPWIVYGFFLFTVTYLQHHDESTVVYGSKTWSFAKAAFETVDRTYGYGIDALHHNITDGHVVHHLFFTKIPHYNLPEATAALKEGMIKNRYCHVYKHRETRDFLTFIWTYLNRHFFYIPEQNIKP